jgi:hypothetical protein
MKDRSISTIGIVYIITRSPGSFTSTLGYPVTLDAVHRDEAVGSLMHADNAPVGTD